MTNYKVLATMCFAVLIAAGCATRETFHDVRAEELHPGTLQPGDRMTVIYEDGTEVELEVADVSGEFIVTDEGEQWPKTGIRSLTIVIPPDSGDCGSLASWKNGKCWSGEISPELCRASGYLICPSIGNDD